MSDSAQWAQALFSAFAFGGLIYTSVLQKRSIDKLSDQVLVLKEQFDHEKNRTNRIMEPKFTATEDNNIIGVGLGRDSNQCEYMNLEFVNYGSDVYDLHLENENSNRVSIQLNNRYAIRNGKIGLHVRTQRKEDSFNILLPIHFRIQYSTIMAERNFVVVNIISIKPENIEDIFN